jgi:hypothetical protein
MVEIGMLLDRMNVMELVNDMIKNPELEIKYYQQNK